MSTTSQWMKFGSSLASSIFDNIFPFRPRNRCCTLKVTGSTLFKCSYRHLWSLRRCFLVLWWRRISKVPLVFNEKFFTDMAPDHRRNVYWVCGPEMKDRVKPILVKNSSCTGTPLCDTRPPLEERFCLVDPLACSSLESVPGLLTSNILTAYISFSRLPDRGIWLGWRLGRRTCISAGFLLRGFSDQSHFPCAITSPKGRDLSTTIRVRWLLNVADSRKRTIAMGITRIILLGTERVDALVFVRKCPVRDGVVVGFPLTASKTILSMVE